MNETPHKSDRLILLPGLDGTGRLFESLIDELRNEIESSIIRLPTDEDQSYERLTRFVRDRLPSGKRVVVLAESFSGPIAYRLLQDATVNVASAIFVASFVRRPSLLVKLAAPLVPSFLFRYWFLPKWAANFLLMGSRGTEKLKVDFWKACKEVGAGVLKQRVKVVGSLSEPDVRISKPCFYIQAEEDCFVPKDNYVEFQKLFDNIRLVSVAGPHLILQTHPKECAQVLRDILKR